MTTSWNLYGNAKVQRLVPALQSREVKHQASGPQLAHKCVYPCIVWEDTDDKLKLTFNFSALYQFKIGKTLSLLPVGDEQRRSVRRIKATLCVGEDMHAGGFWNHCAPRSNTLADVNTAAVFCTGLPYKEENQVRCFHFGSKSQKRKKKEVLWGMWISHIALYFSPECIIKNILL